MDKSFPRVTVWHHEAGTDLPIRTSHKCQILILHPDIANSEISLGNILYSVPIEDPKTPVVA